MQTAKKSVSEERLQLTGILAIIGYGTGATVYRVGTQSWRTFAMKAINKRSKKVQHFSQRLYKEANILRKIQHPNIVGFVSFMPARNLLLLEELDQSLGDRLEVLRERGFGPLPLRQVRFVLAGVCSALDYLHTQKYILHGDIKSHNILIKGDIDEVKLCDFGLSVLLGPDGIGAVEQFVGTLCWAPPEALHGGPITPKVDIFSLGMVVYEMLTMKLPLFNYYRSQNECENTAEEEKDIEAKFPETLSEQYYSFIEIFSWCTEPDYRTRPSARELLEVLETTVFTSMSDKKRIVLDTRYS